MTHDPIEINPGIMCGKPVIKGTRITVEQILRKPSGGMTVNEIIADHPHLIRDDIHATLTFAAHNPGVGRHSSLTQYFPAVVIFDMDGLMFDSERLVLHTWTRAMADFGYQASEEVFQRSVGQTMERTNQVLREEYGADFLLDETNQRTSEYYWQAIDQQGAPLKPGLLALLDFLDEQDMKRAVASSSDRRNIDRMLASAGLTGRFAATMAGDEVQHGKPAPDIFLRAAGLLNVAPDRCLVLEDSEAGTRAAAAAGMTCIIVPDLIEPNPEVAALAAAVLPDLYAVREWLKAGLAVLDSQESRA